MDKKIPPSILETLKSKIISYGEAPSNDPMDFRHVPYVNTEKVETNKLGRK